MTEGRHPISRNKGIQLHIQDLLNGIINIAKKPESPPTIGNKEALRLRT
jgi:hypothetical protein